MLSCLVAAKLSAANLGAPPRLKPPQRFNIFIPQKPESKCAVEVTQRFDRHGIPEVADSLAFNGLRAVAELAVLTDGQLDALCAGLNMGTCVKITVQSLRTAGQPEVVEEPGSGWVDIQTRRELPQSLMRGPEQGEPPLLMTADNSAAFVQLPGRG